MIDKAEQKILERKVKDYLKKEVLSLGGAMRKCKWEHRANAPDWVVLLHGAHFAELKRSGSKGKLSTGQVGEHKIFKEHGVHVWVLTSFEEVDNFINHITRKVRDES